MEMADKGTSQGGSGLNKNPKSGEVIKDPQVSMKPMRQGQ